MKEPGLIMKLAENIATLYAADPYTGEFAVYDRSKTAAEAFGRGTDLYTGLERDIRRYIYAGDRARCLDFYSRDNLAAIYESGETKVIELRFMLGEGPVWIRNTVVPLVGGSKPRLVIGCENIDAEKHREKLEEDRAFLQALQENNDRMLALTDNFESLYDVDLDTGEYEAYLKGQTYSDKVSNRFVEKKEFFADVRQNLERVAYPEDMAGISSVLNRNYIIQALKVSNYFDWYYRLLVDERPVWFRLRVVYKNAEHRRIIVGVFNAEEEMAAKQLSEVLAVAKEQQWRNETMQEIIHSAKWSVFVNPADEITKADYSPEFRRLVNNDILPGECSLAWMVHPDDREAAVAAFNATIADHSCATPYDVTYRMKDRNGEYHWFHSAGRIVRDLRGNGELFGFHIDISDQIEEQVARQNKLQESLTFTDFFLSTYVSAYYVGLEDLSCKIYKRTAELEKNYPVINNYLDSVNDYINKAVHPKDRARLRRVVKPENLKKALKKRPEFVYVFRDISGGEEKIYRFQAFRGADENHVAFGFMDITETVREQEEQQEQIREAERKAEKAMYESAKIFADTFLGSYVSAYYVNLCDCSQIVFNRSKFIEENYGQIDNYLESVTKYIKECVDPDDQERMFSAVQPDYIRERLREEAKFSVYLRDISEGKKRWFRFDVTRGADENHAGLAFSDVTERVEEEKKNARQLEGALALAETANRSKTSFLFNMSHDIRTPMNAITGFTAMAKKYVNDKEKVADYLNKIDVSGKQLLTLVNQVLEMSRIESGLIELEEKPVNVRERFETMATVLAEQADVKGLEFSCDLRNVRHVNLLADDARMVQIVLNIAGNALNYTPEGGKIQFILQELPCERKGFARFVFTMTDTGIGMSREYQEVLFEPFTREKSSTVSQVQGAGLGLAIVKNLVDLLGGTIEVQSELGKGTRVEITTDLKVDPEAAAAEAGAEDEAFTPPVSFAGKRVLLVEDNEINREIAKDILEELGLIVEEAEDGDIAVEMLKRTAERGEYYYYNLVLMDIQMPRLNGYEATKIIRSIEVPEGIRMPIVAMTANAFEEDRRNAFAVGMDEHLAKPVDVEKLLEVLAKFIA